MAKVDYTLQILYNDRLRPTQIWGGDIVDAHHAGVRVAAKTYCTQTLKGADIVVANAYPQNRAGIPRRPVDQLFAARGRHRRADRAASAGARPVHYLNNRLAGRSGATQFDLTAGGASTRGRSGQGNMIVYSQYLSRNMKNYYRKGTFFCDKWADVIAKLRELHPGDPTVAVYPYAGMQHQEIELDG